MRIDNHKKDDSPYPTGGLELMLTDKAKKFDATQTNFPSTASFDEKKASNVLPLERPKQNTGKFKLAESARSAGN